jgi:peptide/nickel transport system substrate-binding protein
MPTSTRSPQCSLATSDYGISGDLITSLPEYWTGSGENSTTGIKDPTLDGLIKTLSSASDQNTADDLLRRVQRRIGDNAYNIVVGQRKPAVIADPAWKGYPVPASSRETNLH